MKKHLPLYGVGPYIVFGQFIFVGGMIGLSYILKWRSLSLSILLYPFRIIGVIFILYGLYLDIQAKYKSKLFEEVKANHLITTGVYAKVRNPVYSGAFIACIGAVLLTNKLELLLTNLICYIIISYVLIYSEEKWLLTLYGKEYENYCKKVPRLIPQIFKKGVH